MGSCGRCTVPRLGMAMGGGGSGCDLSPFPTLVALYGLLVHPAVAPLVVDDVVALPPEPPLVDGAWGVWWRVTVARCTTGVAGGTTSGAGRLAARPPLPAGGVAATTGFASGTQTTSGAAVTGAAGATTGVHVRCDVGGGCVAACGLVGVLVLADDRPLADATLLLPYTGALLLFRIGRDSMTSPARLWERR